MPWAPSYASTSGLAEYVRIGDSEDDTVLGLAIAAASRAVDRHTGRQFGRVDDAQERRYTARFDRLRRHWTVDIDDLMTTDGLTVEVGGAEVAGYTLEPVNAAQKGRPWERLTLAARPAGQGVAITAVWGWGAVPDPVRQATLLQASRLFSRRTSPYGVAGSPEFGSEMRLLAKVDPDVETTLEDFVRHWGAV